MGTTSGVLAIDINKFKVFTLLKITESYLDQDLCTSFSNYSGKAYYIPLTGSATLLFSKYLSHASYIPAIH